jgi:hypothetical protein
MRPKTAVAIVPHYPEREAEIPAIADSSSSMTADEQRLLITDLSSIFDPWISRIWLVFPSKTRF